MPRALKPPSSSHRWVFASISELFCSKDAQSRWSHLLLPPLVPCHLSLPGGSPWVDHIIQSLAGHTTVIHLLLFFFFFSHPSCIYPKEALRKYPPTLTKKGAIKPSSSSSLVLMEITHRAWWLEVAVMGQSPTSSLLAMCLFQGPRTLTKGKSREDC